MNRGITHLLYMTTSTSRPLFLAALSATVLCLTAACAKYPTEPLSVTLAHSEMTRVPDASRLDFQSQPKWDYASSVELLGMLSVADRYQDQALQAYIMQWADTMVRADGSIRGYKPERYNIDHVCPGRLLLALWQRTGEQRFRVAADSLARQMATHPRTSEGAFWHKAVYPHQVWLDGLYMGAPFLAAYAHATGAPDTLWADIARQYCVALRHTRDDSTGLYRHGWDESRGMFWCDSLGRSQHAWGRSNGWLMMGLVATLEHMPQATPGRDTLANAFAALADTLQRFADPATGMWYQVLDQPAREGNFVESSASAMFIYSLLEGARLGLLPASCAQRGRETLARFIDRFVRPDTTLATPDGRPLLRVTDCNAVSGLGGPDRRDGSFDYYIHAPMRDNDPKTLGPLLAALALADL